MHQTDWLYFWPLTVQHKNRPLLTLLRNVIKCSFPPILKILLFLQYKLFFENLRCLWTPFTEFHSTIFLIISPYYYYNTMWLWYSGYRLIGLDAQYSHHNGKVTLQAERCADVIIPETPDPILTSCGVVLLYEDPQSK